MSLTIPGGTMPGGPAIWDVVRVEFPHADTTTLAVRWDSYPNRIAPTSAHA
jgi:hypothetical protein